MAKELVWNKSPLNLCVSNHPFAGATGTEELVVLPLLLLPWLNTADEDGPCREGPGNNHRMTE